MEADRWQRIDAVFAAALEQPAERRRDFLERTCGDDAELRREVESLLAHHRDDGFLARPATAEARRLLAGASLEPQVGERLGRFEILGKLGAGGMGDVYLGHDPKLHRRVALKLLPPHLASDAERVRRFRREALAVSALNHPNILTVYEVVDVEGNDLLVSELVEGVTLRERLRGGPLPLAAALEVAVQIARGLAAAHGVGIVHRDVKPENVMVRDDGLVKLVDFGIAKTSAGGPSDLTRSPSDVETSPGAILGTVSYMSPEQARGEAAGVQADVWALGCVLYEMLAGRQAFSGPTASDVLAAILTREPDFEALPADSPWLVRRILRRCLRKKTEQRFHDVADVRLELEEALDASEHPSAVGNGEGSAGSPSSLRRSRQVAALVVAAGTMAGLLGFLVGALRPHATPPPTLPSNFAVERLTRLPGLESAPTMSADGKSVVYERLGDLWLLRVGGSNAINLSADSPAREFAPAFSPDAQSIAFNSERDGGGIFVMGATGENVRRVTTRGFRPAWTPDGKELVFSGAPSAILVGGVPSPGLDAVDLATSKVRSLCQCVALAPAVSPHGRRVAFLSIVPGRAQRDLWTVPLGGLGVGESPLRLTDDAARDWDPQWSPDGAAVEFVSDRSGAPNLWRLPVDETSGQPRGPAVALPLPASFVAHVRAAADGRTRVYESYARSSVLLRADLDPRTREVRGAPREALRLAEAVYGGSFSPDGKWIVVQGGPSMDDLLLLAVDGSAIRTLVQGTSRNRAPAWSRDGTTVAFQSDRGGKYEIWAIGTDGGGLRRLLTAPSALYGPVWSPDGSLLLATEFDNAQGERLRAVVHRLADPPDRFERLPGLPDSDSFAQGVWSRTGDAIFGFGNRLSLWKWTLAERRYRRVSPPDTSTTRFVDSELPDGRLLVIAETLPPGGASITDMAAEPELPGRRIELLEVDPRSGATRVLLDMPGTYRPGVWLDPAQRTLWINRWREEADLWIARASGPP